MTVRPSWVLAALATLTTCLVVATPAGAAPTDGLTVSLSNGSYVGGLWTVGRVDENIRTLNGSGTGFTFFPPDGGAFSLGTFIVDESNGTTPGFVGDCAPTGPRSIEIVQLEVSGGRIERIAMRTRSTCASGVEYGVFAFHATTPVPALAVYGVSPSYPLIGPDVTARVGGTSALQIGLANVGNTAVHVEGVQIGAAIAGLSFDGSGCPDPMPPLALCNLSGAWSPVAEGRQTATVGVDISPPPWPGEDVVRAGRIDVVGRPAPPPGDGFQPIAPVRLLDTRIGIGAPAAPLGQGPLTVDLAGHGGIPATATAVLANITVTEPTGFGFLTIWPTGVARPTVSNLNFVPGETAPNTSLLDLGDDGAVRIFNSAGSSHVIVDVVGWLSPFAESIYHPLHFPVRLADTREGQSGPSPLGTGEDRAFRVEHPEIPAEATSVLVNITGTDPTTPTHLSVYGGFQVAGPPTTSTVNLRAMQTRANVAVVDISQRDEIRVFNNAGSTHVVIDLIGWFGPTIDDRATSGRIVALEPFRTIDTRVSDELFAPFDAWGYRFPTEFDDAGLRVDSIIFNATVTEPTQPGFLTVFPWDLSYRPYVSTSNFVAGQTIPNQAWVRLAPEPDNYIGVWSGSSGTTHVILDVQGVVLG